MKQPASRAAGAAIAIALVFATASGGRADVVVPTQHNDNQRTGANVAETRLTPQAVQAKRLTRVDRAVDGTINTQILYAPAVSFPDGTHRNVAYVTTNKNSVYAYDAENRAQCLRHGVPVGCRQGLLWHTTLMDPPAVTPPPPRAGCLPPIPYARGIGATPVLEFANGSGTIDVVYSTAAGWLPFSAVVGDELALRKCLTVHFYVVKLDLATGKPKGGPIELQGSMKRGDDGVIMPFVPEQENDVASLLLDEKNNYLYVSFSARQNENVSQYYGWMLRYNADRLTYAGAFNTAPHSWDWTVPKNPKYVPKQPGAVAGCYFPSNGTNSTEKPGRLKPWDGKWVTPAPLDRTAMACVGEGGGIWQGGAGPALDTDGNVYVMTGNAHYDPREGSYGDSIVRLHSKPGGGTSAEDFGIDKSWAPPAERDDDETYDVDLGSAGPLVVDGDGVARSVLVGGKTGIFYVVNGGLVPQQAIVAGTNVGMSDAISKRMRYQTWNQGPHLHGSPTLWRVSPHKAYVYEWAEKDYLKKYEFDLDTGRFIIRPQLSTPWFVRANVLAPHCDQLLCLNAMPGGMLAVSANGSDEASGIVWAIVHGYPPFTEDAIYAFDAQNLTPLWSDKIGAVPHFAGPTVADGHVFVPTNSVQWRFSIYSLDLLRAKQHVAAAKSMPPPGLAHDAAAAMTKIAMARAMPMSNASAGGKIPDYAADPAFRARLQAPALLKSVSPGTIVGAAYAVFGNEVFACGTAGCKPSRTEISSVFPYDDRTGIDWSHPVSYHPSSPKPACSYETPRDSVTLTKAVPDWQLLSNPHGCAVFGDASQVARTWSVFLGNKSTQASVPFFAIYLALEPGA